MYADKTRLSSFGTEKGYPVLAHCANLPVSIRNGEGVGGGRLVGWLPIVSATMACLVISNTHDTSYSLRKAVSKSTRRAMPMSSERFGIRPSTKLSALSRLTPNSE